MPKRTGKSLLYKRIGVPKFDKPEDQKKLEKPSKTPLPLGRPPVPLDMVIAERLAALHCTVEEIASALDVSVNNLWAREAFREVYKRGWFHGRMSMRRMQWRKAVEGDTRMLIFLGKQILGQREYTNTELTTKAPIPIESRPDLDRLSLAELATLKDLLMKAGTRQITAGNEYDDPNVIDAELLPSDEDEDGNG